MLLTAWGYPLAHFRIGSVFVPTLVPTLVVWYSAQFADWRGYFWEIGGRAPVLPLTSCDCIAQLDPRPHTPIPGPPAAGQMYVQYVQAKGFCYKTDTKFFWTFGTADIYNKLEGMKGGENNAYH